MSGRIAASAAAAWPLTLLAVSCVFALQHHSCLAVQTVQVDEDKSYRTFRFSPSAIGPESLAFDPSGGGPYTGVSDGRVLRWLGTGRGWREFAVPPRPSGVTAAECNGSNRTESEDKCGRPLGLQFHTATGDLYIADAYFGLLRVGPKGGVATRLVSAAEGVPFSFVNGVDLDQNTGMVYFTDTSTQYQRRDWIVCVATLDPTGRFMSYDPATKQVKVLIRGLEFANGVAVSKDASFVLVNESTKQRILRYWLKGAKAGSYEVFANVSGYPDNVRRTGAGEFWVGINTGRGKIESEATGGLGERKQIGTMSEDTVGVRFDEAGRILEELTDSRDDGSLSEISEHNGVLWMGSVVSPYVGVIRRV